MIIMTRWDLITSDEYISVNVESIIRTMCSVRRMREEANEFIINLRNELLQEPWIPLKAKLPPANQEVQWYDAMFDKVMIFALGDPSTHDPDFSHWMPKPKRPKQYDKDYTGNKAI